MFGCDGGRCASRTTRFWLVAPIVVTAGAVLFYLSEVPLGRPGVWHYVRAASPPWQMFPLPAVPVTLLILLCLYGLRHADRLTRRGEMALVAALCLCAFAAQTSTTVYLSEFGLAEAVIPFYHENCDGTFRTEARTRVKDVGAYLARYQDRLRSGGESAHRVETHPPGLVLAMLAITRSVESQPRIAEGLYRLSTGHLPPGEALFGRGRANVLRATDGLVASLLCYLGSAALVIPGYWLTRALAGRRRAVLVAGFCGLIPGVYAFAPVFDQVFPVAALLLLSLVLLAWRRRSRWLAFLAGAGLYAALFFTIAFLTLIPLLGLIFLVALLRLPRGRRAAALKTHWPLAAAAAVGWLVPELIMTVVFRYELVGVARLCMANNQGIYLRSHRTYWPWLFLNTAEIALSAGLPLVLIALVPGARLLSRCVRQKRLPEGGPLLLAGFLVTMLMLLVSGSVRAEVSRNWLFLVPIGAVVSVCALEEEVIASRRLAGVLLGCQALQALVSRAILDPWRIGELLKGLAGGAGGA